MFTMPNEHPINDNPDYVPDGGYYDAPPLEIQDDPRQTEATPTRGRPRSNTFDRHIAVAATTDNPEILRQVKAFTEMGSSLNISDVLAEMGSLLPSDEHMPDLIEEPKATPEPAEEKKKESTKEEESAKEMQQKESVIKSLREHTEHLEAQCAALRDDTARVGTLEGQLTEAREEVKRLRLEAALFDDLASVSGEVPWQRVRRIIKQEALSSSASQLLDRACQRYHTMESEIQQVREAKSELEREAKQHRWELTEIQKKLARSHTDLDRERATLEREREMNAARKEREQTARSSAESNEVILSRQSSTLMVESFNKQMETLRIQLSSNFQMQMENLESSQKASLEMQKANFELQLQTRQQQHELEVKSKQLEHRSVTQEHEAALASLKRECELTVQQLKASHAADTAQAANRHTAAIHRLTTSSQKTLHDELQELRDKLADQHTAAQQKLADAHRLELTGVRERHRAAVAEKKQSISNTTNTTQVIVSSKPASSDHAKKGRKNHAPPSPRGCDWDAPVSSIGQRLASENKALLDENTVLKGELKQTRQEVEMLNNEVTRCKEVIAIQAEHQHSDAVEEYIHMTVMLIKSKYPNIDCSSERLIDLAKEVPLDSVYERVDAFCSRLQSTSNTSSRSGGSSKKGSGLNFSKLNKLDSVY